MPSELSEVRLELPDASATEALGELLGRRLRPGDGLALTGDLGAGKTCVARGVGRGLGLDDPDAVQSPTYLLVMEHPGPVPMLHVDAYLAEKTRAFLGDGGLDYLLSSPAVVVPVADTFRSARLARVETRRSGRCRARGRSETPAVRVCVGEPSTAAGWTRTA